MGAEVEGAALAESGGMAAAGRGGGGLADPPGGGVVASMQADVERALELLIEREMDGLPPAVGDPIRYAVLGPGKRLRPLLLIGAYRACGGRHAGVAELACSVELVHAYSLAHDDLPCMDDDVLRRGRPTLHVRFGVPAAVLAGAALMPLAVRTIWHAGETLGLPETAVRRLITTLTTAAGARAMVGGQLLDLRAEGRRVMREELERIHAGKTAALIAASVVMGGIAAGAEEEVLAGLSRFGYRLGLAFQAVDDILDLTGTDQELGKQSGRDVALGKATYPALFGLEEAERISRELAERARRELDRFPNGVELREIADYVIRRRR
ncbi:MAG: polyprenyl synthetase family protein [Gemmatimonadota bacterium]